MILFLNLKIDIKKVVQEQEEEVPIVSVDLEEKNLVWEDVVVEIQWQE